MNRIAVFTSGPGAVLKALVDACAEEALNAQVAVLVADKKCPAIHIAEKAGIPIVFQAWGPYKVAAKLRSTYDRDLALRVWLHQPDLVVLEEWPRPLTSSFLERFPEQVIRLHLALPGAFPGPYAMANAWDAWQRGEIDRTGVSVQRVGLQGAGQDGAIAQQELQFIEGESYAAYSARMQAAVVEAALYSVAQILES